MAEVRGGGEMIGEPVEVAVLRMDHGVDLAEGQELVAALVAEELVQRIRPIHAAAGEIPVEQPAASASEGRIDAVPHLLADLVRRPGAGGLHEIGRSHPDEHDHHGHDEGDLAEGARLPGGKHERDALHDRDLAAAERELAHGGDRLRGVAEGEGHDAGAVGVGGDDLDLALQVREPLRGARRGRIGGQHGSAGVDEKQGASAGDSRFGKRAGQGFQLARGRRPIEQVRLLDRQGGKRGDDVDLVGGVLDRFAAVLQDLQAGAGGEAGQEDGEERRNGEAKPGFGALRAGGRRDCRSSARSRGSYPRAQDHIRPHSYAPSRLRIR